MAENNQVRFRMGGTQVHTLTLDAGKLMGDALLELERELAPESAFAWIDRMIRTLQNWRTRDVRIRDILGIVYLSRAQSDPGITWDDVAKETAPFAVEILDDDEPTDQTTPPPPPPAPTMSVSPVTAALAQKRVAEIGMPDVKLPDAEPQE